MNEKREVVTPIERDMSVGFLGRELGKASGWDGEQGETWWVYDFVPINGVGLPRCECLQFDEINGKIRAQDKAGNDLQVFTIKWDFV